MFAYRNYLKTLLKFSRSTNNRSSIRVNKWLHKSAAYCCKDDKDDKEKDIAGSVSSKYEVFVDEKSPIIFDVEHEREKFYEVTDESEALEKRKKDFVGISPERGKKGVIDLDELFTILRKENAINIVVLKIPEEYAYVDYFVIVTAKSWRHMNGMGEYIRRVYKYKTKSDLNIPEIEGKGSKDWKALDLGNIALHIMSESAREYFDLESLWSVGKEYDPKCHAQDNSSDYSYASILSQLQPAS